MTKITKQKWQRVKLNVVSSLTALILRIVVYASKRKHLFYSPDISSVDNNGIKYSNNSVRAFDKDLSVGISSYSEVYVTRMNDVILQR